MIRLGKHAFFFVAITSLFTCGVVAQEKKPPKITFDDHVKPIFVQKCASCHNPDKKSADLDLTNYSSLMQGGASGGVIEPGDASASYLYELVTHESEPIMPPESPKIPDPMIETIRKWIDGGVLENTGSKAKASKKKKYDLALAAPSTERPAVVPLPGRLSLQPHTYSDRRTAVDALATSPWAPLVAVGSQEQVLLYNTQSLELVGTLAFPEGTPRVLKFSRNGGLLLAGGGVGGASGRVVVWNIRNGQRIIEIGSELDEILAADISSDQTLIALGGPQRVVRIYATETGQLLHEIRKHTEWITSLEFSPDSVLLATGDRNGGLFVWEGWTGREYLTLKGHSKGISSVSWRSDSNILASSSEDASIRLWEMENGANIKNWGAHGGGAMSVEFTRDGRLFSCGRDKVAKLWDQNGAQQRAFEAFGDLALESTYCDETGRAIAGDWSGEIRVWNATDGTRVGELFLNAPKLEMRLTEANRLVQAKQTAIAPIQQTFTAAKTTFDKINADYSVATKQVSETKAQADRAASEFSAAQAVLAKTTSDHSVAQQRAKMMAKGLPELQAAAAKIAVAADAIGDDPAIAAAAKTIVEKSASRSAQLKSLTENVAMMGTKMDQSRKEMEAKQAAAAKMSEMHRAAVVRQKQLMPMIAPAQQAMQTEKAKLDTATVELNQAKQLVARWNDEIRFAQQLESLNRDRLASIKSIAELEIALEESSDSATQAATLVSKAEADIRAAQLERDAVAEKILEVQKLIAASKNMLATEKIARENVMAAMKQADAVLAKLNQALALSNEAVAMTPADAQLVSTRDSLHAVVGQKAKARQVMMQDLAAKQRAEQATAQKISEDEKSAAAYSASKSTMDKKIVDLRNALKPLSQKAMEVNQKLEASKASLVEARNRLDGLIKTIAITQGLGPAA